MKTTLNLDDELLRRAKERAHEQGTTLTAVIENALRTALPEPASVASNYAFDFPSVQGGGPALVDPADRLALHDLTDG